jgi:hypothetical protein
VAEKKLDPKKSYVSSDFDNQGNLKIKKSEQIANNEEKPSVEKESSKSEQLSSSEENQTSTKVVPLSTGKNKIKTTNAKKIGDVVSVKNKEDSKSDTKVEVNENDDKE